MPSLKERLEDVREQHPLLDHVLRMNEHYGRVKGSLQAGAVTYFAFLSFFPVLAVSFFFVGYVARVYPDARDNLVEGIGQLLPGIIGAGEGQINLADIEQSAGAVGLVGLAGVLYAGLGWLSAMRDALVVVFEVEQRDQPNIVIGKLRDLVTLALIGTVLIVSVAISSLVSRFSEQILDWVGLATELSPLLKLVTVALGIGANMVLFFALFALLAQPHTPRRSLWSGALLGALGFEVLKRLSGLLLGLTENSPAFQAFGIALILLVWINYFSRVVMYAASWAHTSPAARAEAAERNPPALPEGPAVGPVLFEPAVGAGEVAPNGLRAPAAAAVQDTRTGVAFVAGGTAALVLTAVLRRNKQ
ncbi:YihY/virulence factor BrkB family protein [uncultured Nocardioides sp.]|uniref:YihY/virulence factor BrkB family protein n=1 Tax=uncultured Nocardioides sp. TaxID=198441 RepID=UPI0026004222|nr:YihY/virulence factor BrkB family protein [uncultured Nocardioides sp.]